jgi:hypothetical protein
MHCEVNAEPRAVNHGHQGLKPNIKYLSRVYRLHFKVYPIGYIFVNIFSTQLALLFYHWVDRFMFDRVNESVVSTLSAIACRDLVEIWPN